MPAPSHPRSSPWKLESAQTPARGESETREAAFTLPLSGSEDQRETGAAIPPAPARKTAIGGTPKDEPASTAPMATEQPRSSEPVTTLAVELDSDSLGLTIRAEEILSYAAARGKKLAPVTTPQPPVRAVSGPPAAAITPSHGSSATGEITFAPGIGGVIFWIAALSIVLAAIFIRPRARPARFQAAYPEGVEAFCPLTASSRRRLAA